MRREVTASAVLKPRIFLSLHGPGNLCADCVAITSHAFQLDPEPVVPFRRSVFEQQRRTTVIANQHIDRSVIVVISNSQAPGRKGFLKRWTRLSTDIVKLPIFLLMKQKQWLFI